MFTVDHLPGALVVTDSWRNGKISHSGHTPHLFLDPRHNVVRRCNICCVEPVKSDDDTIDPNYWKVWTTLKFVYGDMSNEMNSLRASKAKLRKIVLGSLKQLSQEQIQTQCLYNGTSSSMFTLIHQNSP